MNIATNIFIFSGWLFALLFVVGYATLAPWWKTDIGRHMMSFGVLLLAVLSLSASSVIFGLDYVARPFVRLVIFGSLAFILAWRVEILVRSQIKGKK